MASTGSVPPLDLARWLGTERGWSGQLAVSGELVSEREGGALLVGPSSLESWLHRRRGDADGDDAGLGMLGVVGGILSSGGPAEPVAQGVIEHLTQRFGAASAAIFLAAGNDGGTAGGKGSLRLVASSRSGNGSHLTEVCGEIARWVHATGRPISLCDPRRVGLPG